MHRNSDTCTTENLFTIHDDVHAFSNMLKFVLLLKKVRICIIIFRIGISYFILLVAVVCVYIYVCVFVCV